MALTYESIASTLVTSDVTSVTFSNIPSTYTDLYIFNSIQSSSPLDIYCQFNNDTTTNYSFQHFSGTDTNSLSVSKQASASAAYADWWGYAEDNTRNPSSMYIFQYTNTNWKKTWFIESTNMFQTSPTGYSRGVGSWQSTAAISTITFVTQYTNRFYRAGSIFSIYGIKSA